MKVITIETKNVYGKENIYIVGPEAPIIAQLTGKRTVDNNDIAALLALGFEVKEAAKAERKFQLA